MINQRQIIALLQGAEPAYRKGSEMLTTAIHDFDLAYNAYNEFQQRMERYWCLRFLIQQNLQEVDATVWRDNLVRLDGMPYITKVHSLPELTAGERVRLKVERVDPLLMELNCKFLVKLET